MQTCGTIEKIENKHKDVVDLIPWPLRTQNVASQNNWQLTQRSYELQILHNI